MYKHYTLIAFSSHYSMMVYVNVIEVASTYGIFLDEDAPATTIDCEKITKDIENSPIGNWSIAILLHDYAKSV